jgi:polysaccharide biosynthesis/export protein
MQTLPELCMIRPLRFLLSVSAAVVMLSACALPRGAPEEGQILAGAEDPAATFAVEAVTRDTLDDLKSWPITAPTGVQGWISRSRGPSSQLIESGDAIDLVVWDNEESSLLTNSNQKVVELAGIVVSPQGEVFLPYVSDIYIAKMSPDEARQAIQERMVMIIPSAQVQLIHAPGRKSSVDLISGVRKAGNYPLPNRDYTILSLIAEGGGLDEEIKNPQIRLQRDGKLFGISMDKLLESPDLDTTLRGGDKVYVETDERFFLSLGAAGKEAQIAFPTDTVTALDAASLVGGVNEDRGNMKAVLILRDYAEDAVRTDRTGPSKERVIFAFDMTTADGLFSAGDFPVQHRDLVLVTESPITGASTIIGLVFEALGIGTRAAAL